MSKILNFNEKRKFEKLKKKQLNVIPSVIPNPISSCKILPQAMENSDCLTDIKHAETI